ncbi:patatin-like phospholipase family protein (plasmid) [Tolypothrix sp. PCC 7910]|uniref:patatin-like phospholipase family protein n=1 Tax=Tolypothrix sp. PCC 7910 TaxID=2099387 RepID=UPI0014279BF8|nr:patatin-like phospholipase family protein [Tolypothrix sp. PCC 7910]QIR41713.1 patatin-like phospholipase family protein [Tolypothrix sp. PCC 7910]
MSDWNPSKIREERQLLLTAEEKEKIRQKLPCSIDDQIYADAVFEGGGVKGIAFLGALRCCSDIGICWKKLAGTSAGAITAALLAADFTIEELEEIIGKLNFMDFLTKKTSPLIFNGDPSDDLDNPLWMIINVEAVAKTGEYSTAPFKKWLQETLSSRNFKTFNDIKDKERELKIVISDISIGQMLVLPDDLITNNSNQDLELDNQLVPKLDIENNKQFEVAEAVRLSMSIPFFFEPGYLGDNVIVDGGVLSNFPLWIYDVNPEMGKPPEWPTFGFRLINQQVQQPSLKTNNTKKMNAIEIFMAIMHTMNVASDRYHLRKSGKNRVIELNDNGIKTTQFNLTDDEKTKLYVDGYNNTKQFFLEKWNWDEHLASRGYSKSKK